MSYCKHCQSELSNRRFFLSRRVGIFRYSNREEIDRITVLYSDILNQFCCVGCADVSIPKQLESLEIKKLGPELDSDVTCAKYCDPVDLTAPHVAYSLMEAAKVSKPENAFGWSI